ncbi:hypothetical protein N658DRAFT_565073 [Parathielavia hyrcaniae]|uniref:Dystroglycan-type cadherin-like domain-containing protein n=1 Tax=Parathielavia hyrcaniae TaxID=113614 RepID=A0AAN6Q5Y1_9PEZI|nr:hypothetical protein N658DRAFT_565073 [Parathielavia hyrcaniae]
MASPAVFWATVLFFASLSATSPSIVFPINSQVPPVARIGESFSFVLSPSTFTSSSPIPYSLSNAPKWLSVDSDARRLFGTPGPDDVPSGDVAGVPVNLVATDDTGSTTHTATLVVSRASAPTVEIPFEKQAPPDFGTFSSPSAILSGPGEAFSPPQRFPFQVMASDVVGFAGATMGFDIYVGTHQLGAQETVIVLNATRGTLLSFTGLMDTVKTGVLPDEAESTKFTVTLRDTFTNHLNLTILVKLDGGTLAAGLFTGSLPEFAITPGQPFSFDIRAYLVNPQDTELSVAAGSSYSWIQFDASTATLSGDAPDSLEDGLVTFQIQARSRDSNNSASSSVNIVLRAVSGSAATPSESGQSWARPTGSSGGHRPLTGDGSGNGQFNPVLLAYLRRRKDRQRPPLSTRDISGPLPGTFVTSAAPLPAPNPLPDFTKRFGKSFSADDVFGPEKKGYFESRNALLTRPDLPRHPESVRALPSNGSASPDPGGDDASADTGGMPAVASGTECLVTLRPGTRGKISSSLSSITETSIGELVDSQGIESSGRDSRQSFRDKIEIHVPRLQIPRQAFTASPSLTDDATSSTPRPDSSRTAPETVPLRAESRFSYYPPPASSVPRKLSWRWLKGVKGRRQGLMLVPWMRRLSEQPSVLTVDTQDSDETERPPPPPTPPQAAAHEGKNPATSTAKPEEHRTADAAAAAAIPGPAGSPLVTQEEGEEEEKSSTPPPPPPGFPVRGATPAESLDVYDDIVGLGPFHSSKTWSTVPTVPTTDDWVDETVSSLALSRTASQHHHQQQQPNWTALQESPVHNNKSQGAMVVPDAASSVRLPRAAEGEGDPEGKGKSRLEASADEPSRPATAPAAGGRRDDERREKSGLTCKSQSKGVSLRSEGSRSDYAVFI